MTEEKELVEWDLVQLDEAIRERRTALRTLLGISIIMPIFIVSIFISSGYELIGGLILVLATVAAVVSFAKLTVLSREEYEVHELCSDRPALVNAMLDNYDASPGMACEIKQSILCRNLPLLQESESSRLTRRSRKRLYEALRVPEFFTQTEFLIAILHSCSQIGDEEALKLVTKIDEPQGDSPREEQVRNAARECLPALQERVERLKTSAFLLRPSVQNDCPDQLLRPAQGVLDEETSSLLRAVNVENAVEEP